MPKSQIDRRPYSALAALTLALIVLGVCFAFLRFVSPVQKAATWLDDFRLAYLTPLIEQNTEIAVLSIDEETVSEMAYRSPIDRQFIAGLIEELNTKHNVRAIGIDLTFDQPTIAEQDEHLQWVMKNSRIPVVVAAGGASAGMTDKQLAFQSSYLDSLQTGSAVLSVEGGVVRTHYPYVADDEAVSFVNALALAANLTPPSDPTGIIFRRGSLESAQPFPIYPAHTVDYLPAEWLDGRIILIGADLLDRDRHRTPLSVLGNEHSSMAGMLIHAMVLAQITTGTYLPVMSAWQSVALLLISVIIGLALALSPVPARLRLIIGIGLFVSYWLAAFSGWVFWRVPLPILGPSVGFLVAATAATAFARRREHRQKLFIHNAFNHYISTQIVDDILANPEHLQLGGETRDMSFIFTDIAGFSTLVERVTPDEVVNLLSGYLDGLVEIALSNGGTIARFVGDSLVVFFGAPLSQHDHSHRAVNCALQFDKFCEVYRNDEGRAKSGFGVTRIGVHSGNAVVGNVGGSRRFEYTAHGDSVNTAARLESANRHFGSRVCVSRDAAEGYTDADFRPIGSVILKGKTQALTLFTTWDGLDAADQAEYMQLYEMMRRLDPRSEEELTKLAARRPGDGLLNFHLQRFRAGEIGIEFELREK